MTDQDEPLGRGKRARRTVEEPTDAGSSRERPQTSASAAAVAARPTEAERQHAMATVAAMKAAPLDPPLLGPKVAVSRCVPMLSAAMALRCGEAFPDWTSAMHAFGVKNCSKPSDLQIWLDKLARLAEYEGAALTAVERALVDERGAAQAAALAAAERARAAKQAHEQEHAALLREYEAHQRLAMLKCSRVSAAAVQQCVEELKALPYNSCEYVQEHLWGRPGTRDEWEAMHRSNAETQLQHRAVEARFEPLSLRFEHRSPCAQCPHVAQNGCARQQDLCCKVARERMHMCMHKLSHAVQFARSNSELCPPVGGAAPATVPVAAAPVEAAPAAAAPAAVATSPVVTVPSPIAATPVAAAPVVAASSDFASAASAGAHSTEENECEGEGESESEGEGEISDEQDGEESAVEAKTSSDSDDGQPEDPCPWLGRMPCS